MVTKVLIQTRLNHLCSQSYTNSRWSNSLTSFLRGRPSTGLISHKKHSNFLVFWSWAQETESYTRRRGWSLWHKCRFDGPRRCHLVPQSLRSNPGSTSRPSPCPPSCGRETTALNSADPDTEKDQDNTYLLPSIYMIQYIYKMTTG